MFFYLHISSHTHHLFSVNLTFIVLLWCGTNLVVVIISISHQLFGYYGFCYDLFVLKST